MTSSNTADTKGCDDLIYNLKREVMLGMFRANNNSNFTFVNIIPATYSTAIESTLSTVLAQLRLKNFSGVANLSGEYAREQTAGICVMTYLKLRAANVWISDTMDRFLHKPKVPSPFRVPEPYALAISELGLVEISSMVNPIIAVPSAAEADAEQFLLDQNMSWSPANYCQAQSYAENLGMLFASLDLSVKWGSCWWLHRNHVSDRVRRLECTYPEANITETEALIATLFICDGDGRPVLSPFDLSALTETYGSMTRNPPNSSYYKD